MYTSILLIALAAVLDFAVGEPCEGAGTGSTQSGTLVEGDCANAAGPAFGL